MLNKLDFLIDKYKELSDKVSDPEIIADNITWTKYIKEHAEIEPVVFKYQDYKQTTTELSEAKEMLGEAKDKEFEEMVKNEITQLTLKKEALEEQLKFLLLPKDPYDEKNVLMEIRAGTGGEEAALFAGTLFRMYSRYAERRGWKTEIMSSNATNIGGFKEMVFLLEGRGAYSRLKYESGVHRVQRIPSTESGGRIHTSAATVVVLPEAEDVDVDINPNELRVDVFRSSGHGGQSVNTTDSAVRITHLPSGLVVSCQDEKSQLKNKEKALKVLKSRLLDMEIAKQHAEIAKSRKSQVGSGDRSQRIRTYNYPQGRVTDHRIGVTIHQLENFLDGDLEEMIDSLITSDQAQKLQSTHQ